MSSERDEYWDGTRRAYKIENFACEPVTFCEGDSRWD